jgi:hypothetical protein
MRLFSASMRAVARLCLSGSCAKSFPEKVNPPHLETSGLLLARLPAHQTAMLAWNCSTASLASA